MEKLFHDKMLDFSICHYWNKAEGGGIRNINVCVSCVFATTATERKALRPLWLD